MSEKIDFTDIKQFEKYANQAVEKAGYALGDEAKNKVDIFKTYTEFKRNKYLFWNAVILSIIGIANLTLGIIRLVSGKE